MVWVLVGMGLDEADKSQAPMDSHPPFAWDVQKATIEEKTLVEMARAGDAVTGWYFGFHHF